MKNTLTYLKYIPMKTQQHCRATSYSQYFFVSPFALIRYVILLGIEWLSSSMTLAATLNHGSHTGFHVSFFYMVFGYQNSFFIIFQKFSCLANSLVILLWVFLYNLGMF